MRPDCLRLTKINPPQANPTAPSVHVHKLHVHMPRLLSLEMLAIFATAFLVTVDETVQINPIIMTTMPT